MSDDALGDAGDGGGVVGDDALEFALWADESEQVEEMTFDFGDVDFGVGDEAVATLADERGGGEDALVEEEYTEW